MEASTGSARSRIAVLVLVAGLLVAAVPAQAVSKGPVARSLKSLVRATKALPRGPVSKAKKRKLVHAATHARKVARKRPCTAVRDLNRYRRLLGGVKFRKPVEEMDTMTISGHLSGAPPNSEIEVSDDPPHQGHQTRTTQSRYAGDDERPGAQSTECAIEVFRNS